MALKEVFVWFMLLTLNYTLAEITDEEYLSMPELFHLDDYDRCMLYDTSAIYCKITFQLRPKNPGNIPEVWKIIQEVSSKSTNYRHDLIRHWICVPETCPNITKPVVKDGPLLSQMLSECFRKKYEHLGLGGDVVLTNCYSKESDYPIDGYDIAFAALFALYLLWIVVASFYEAMMNHKRKNEIVTSWKKTLSAFSIQNNWQQLKTVNLDNPDVKSMRAIQGVRFYSTLIVIETHVILGYMSYAVSNPIFMETITEKFATKILASSTFVVQMFFMVSAWLLTYNFSKDLKGKDKVSLSYIVRSFINRYFRLTPCLAVVIAFTGTWFAKLSNGPTWDDSAGVEYRNCRKNWWISLLYLNNYIDQVNMCLPQSWYLGVEMQFFVAGQLLLWLIWNHPDKIKLVLAVPLIVQIITMFTTTYLNNWEALFMVKPETGYLVAFREEKDFQVTYASAYAQLSGLVAGIAYGFVFYTSRNKPLKMRNWVWWTLSWCVFAAITILPGLIFYSTFYQHNRLVAATYKSVALVIFVFSFGLGLLGMCKGLGGMLLWIFEWKPTYVLGRLSYCAYLVHSIVLRVGIGLRRRPVYLSYYVAFTESISVTVLSFIVALFMTLLIEMPLDKLRKQLLTEPKNVSGLKQNKHLN